MGIVLKSTLLSSCVSLGSNKRIHLVDPSVSTAETLAWSSSVRCITERDIVYLTITRTFCLNESD